MVLIVLPKRRLSSHPVAVFGGAVVAAIVGGVVGGGAAMMWAGPDRLDEQLFIDSVHAEHVDVNDIDKRRSTPTLGPMVDLLELTEIARVVPRADWDSDADDVRPLRRRARPLSTSSFIVVHHSDFADAPGPATILDYHRGPAGFADIGYHFVVARDGTVYEGRAIDVVGAHAGISRQQRYDKSKDPDDDAIGVVLDGSFEDATPSAHQLTSALRLIRNLRARYGVPGRQVIGHRDVKEKIVEAQGLTFAGTTTVCPGDALANLLPAIRLWSAPQAGVVEGVVGDSDVVSVGDSVATRTP
jgi:hypothetical protein